MVEKKLYKYRKWTLDGKLGVVVRAEVDSFMKTVNDNAQEIT